MRDPHEKARWQVANRAFSMLPARRALVCSVLTSTCLLYNSDAADEQLCVDLGGRLINNKKRETTDSKK
ncbi:hypothetical protein, partial [Burkholderia cenocepacia]|uniref:hypothetical protein n=1 Tax=Burkholderia cenocepacia TaxID=95486 RepID=UPI001C4DDC7C